MTTLFHGSHEIVTANQTASFKYNDKPQNHTIEPIPNPSREGE